MSSIVYLRNRKTNTIYAYLNESIWDPEKKKCINKRKCIGHLDPDTGQIVPNRANRSRECPIVKSHYLCDIYDKMTDNLQLRDVLSLCFPDDWKKILSVAYYLAATEKELQFSKQWSEEHTTPYNNVLTSTVVSDLFGSISSNAISLFFTLWKLRLEPEETYVTSINYRETNYDSRNYLRDFNIPLKSQSNRIKMDIYFSSKNNIPICYQLSNMATGRKLGDYGVNPSSFSRLSSFLDEESGEEVDPSLIAYANSNLMVRMRPENEFVRSIIEKSEPTITNPENFRTLLGTPLFIETYMHHVNARKFYIHVFFDPNKAVGDLFTFISLINFCKYEVETDRMDESHQSIYDKYLIIKEENGETVVEHNSEAILHHNEYLGYSAIVSNFTRNPSIAMVPFIQMKLISNMFDNMFNDYDNTTFNMFTDNNHLSRIFIQFISLIIRLEAENVMNAKKLNRSMSYKEMVSELSNIKTVKIPGQKKLLQTNLSDVQVRILEAFELDYMMD